MKSAAPIPHLVVNDGVAAIQFYEAAFGAVCNSKHLTDDGKRIMHADLTLGSGTIFLNDDFPELEGRGGKTPMQLGGTSVAIHLDVPDADAAWAQAIGAGAEVCVPLENQSWGMRYGKLKDPFGHLWSIGGPLK